MHSWLTISSGGNLFWTGVPGQEASYSSLTANALSINPNPTEELARWDHFCPSLRHHVDDSSDKGDFNGKWNNRSDRWDLDARGDFSRSAVCLQEAKNTGAQAN